MFGIKKLIHRPKLDDWAPLAKFYYADQALSSVAAELDSTDGRRNPERCQQLIATYRQNQDRVLQIIEEIMSEAFHDDSDRAPREFRVKFPDDILHENLPGQLWFGAECLAVGSNIVDREFESEALRPLAKSFVEKVDALRKALKQQSLKNVYSYTDQVRKLLRDFDCVFADFELSYVSAMVPVKSAKEYEMLLEVAVLFSDSLMRAVQKGYMSQAMIDDCDPSIMFTLPRLAIVCGLLYNPDGPLRVDKPGDQLPEMFRPFRGLLQKIRDLLHTLTPEELVTLERALSSQDGPQSFSDQPTNVLKVADFKDREKCKSAGLNKDVVPSLLDASTISNPTDSTLNVKQKALRNQESTSSESASYGSAVEVLENSEPGTIRGNGDLNRSSSSDSMPSLESDHEEFSINDSVLNTTGSAVTSESAPSAENTSISKQDSVAEKDDKKEEIAAIMKQIRNENLRAGFRSSEDLIHRLFISISAVADQWQTYYPSDSRAVLKMVLHPGDVHNVYEVYGRPARGTGREEETGIEASESVSIESSLPQLAPNAAAGINWIPDNECSSCTACHAPFTLVRRRHHCRNCGKIFCGKCSRNTAPLLKYGYKKPVRVCDKCFFYKLIPFCSSSEQLTSNS